MALSVVINLSEILLQQYQFNREAAALCTGAFLEAFRACPDNPDVPLDTWRQYLWSQALPDTHRHLAADLYRRWLDLRYRYLALTPEIVALLQSLRQSYLLAIITNGPSHAQWEKVQRLNLNGFFDCILVSSDLPWEKPNPHIFMAACNYLGVEPRNCIMIGDKLETDIQGGIEAKLGGTIWIPLNGDMTQLHDVTTSSSTTTTTTTTTITPTIVYRPDYIIQTLPELLQILPAGDNAAATAKKNSFRSSNKANNVRRVPYNRRVASLPDLESGNSNSSDGS